MSSAHGDAGFPEASPATLLSVPWQPVPCRDLPVLSPGSGRATGPGHWVLAGPKGRRYSLLSWFSLSDLCLWLADFQVVLPLLQDHFPPHSAQPQWACTCVLKAVGVIAISLAAQRRNGQVRLHAPCPMSCRLLPTPSLPTSTCCGPWARRACQLLASVGPRT